MDALKVVRRSPVVSALAVLAATALLFVSEGTHWQAVKALEALTASHEARKNVRELHIGMLDAETAQRGYLLTRRKEYLQPYAGGVAEVTASLAELDASVADDTHTAEMLAALRLAVQAKLAEMAQTIRLMDAGQADLALALMANDAGMKQMVTIRALTTELLAQEMAVRIQARADLQSTLTWSRIGVASLSLIGLLALYLYLRHGMAAKDHQRNLEQVAQVEHARLEADVLQRTAQLTDLTRHLLSAREDERNRLARNLHDELGALLTSAKLDAARIRSRLGGTAPEAQERLAHLVETLNSSIALGRRIIEDLRPSTLANLGLVPALEILAREFGASSGLEMHCALTPVRLSAAAELVLFRLVQEAFTNLGKHAQARHVWLSLAAQDGVVGVTVRDDGVGFDTRVAPTSAYGLLGMRYRAEAEQGVLTVESAPGQGTSVQLRLPESD